MGKKMQQKKLQQSSSAKDSSSSNQPTIKKLSPMKRNELNHLIDKLLQLSFTASESVKWEQYVEIQSVLARIRNIESEMKIKSTGGNRDRMSYIKAFTKWAQDNGAEFDGIEIVEFPNMGLGLKATKDFAKDNLFAIVPNRMIMSLDNVSTAISPMMSQLPMIESMHNVKLAFSLLVERLDADSFWKPYIDLLPTKYSTVMNFSVSEMQELKGSSALSYALNQCKSIARQYAFIHKFLQTVRDEQTDPVLELLRSKFTYELYCWAVSTVMTRQNSLPRLTTSGDANPDGVQTMPALIPLWDLANHIDNKDARITSSYNAEKNQIEGLALFDFKKGDQICIYYGARNNTNLLIHNGFINQNNSTDSISTRIGLSTQGDPLFNLRCKLLDLLGISNPIAELDFLPAPQFISPKLLAFVRVFNMSEDELEHWTQIDRNHNELLEIDYKCKTESKTWEFLKMRLLLLLKIFPTTLTDDQEMIDGKGSNKIGHIRTMCIQYRILEKTLLTNTLAYVNECIIAKNFANLKT